MLVNSLDSFATYLPRSSRVEILLTFCAFGQLNDITNTDVNDTEETLILLFELLLVKYLYS
jgi:hypothetical protein